MKLIQRIKTFALVALGIGTSLSALASESDYDFYEYISSEDSWRGISDGPALVITDFRLEANNCVETKIRRLEEANNGTVFCCRDNNSANQFSLFMLTDSGRYWRHDYGNKQISSLTDARPAWNKDVDYTLRMSAKELTTNAVSALSFSATPTFTDIASSPLMLFASNNTGGGDKPEGNRSKMRMYYFTVYADSTKSTVRLALVPAMRLSDSVAGMYDRVNDKFYSSAVADRAFSVVNKQEPENSVSRFSVTVSPVSSVYSGSEMTPLLTIRNKTTTLCSGVAASAIPSDAGFTASWSGTIQNPGTYTLTLAGDGETYVGTKANAATFTVSKIELPYPKAVKSNSGDCPDQANFYDGKGLKYYCDYTSHGQHGDPGNYLVTAKIKSTYAALYAFPDGSDSAKFQWMAYNGTLTPMSDADVPHFSPARTFKYDGNAKSVTFADASGNNRYAVVSGKGTTSATAAGLYTAYVWPKAGYAWPDGSFEMRPYEWSIVPSNYTDDRNFLQSLANDPHRVNASALPTGISGGDLILRYPNYDDGGNVVSHDFVHIYTNTAASGFVFENNSGIPRKGRALIVGGGGAGGSDAGRSGWEENCPTAGGGGGGAVRSVSDLNLIGSFSVKVGVGGTSSQTSGGMSEIAGTGFAYSALGGGRGGTASKSSSDGSNGCEGGSGGGGGGWKLSDTSYGGGTGGQGSSWGCNGAAGSSDALGGGGGGAGKEASGYDGGYGACSDIIGNELICFGGGGASARLSSNADMRYPASGGIGGGGSSLVNQYRRETDFYSRPGVNGLGGGGSAKPLVSSGSAQSGERGGDGIVIIRYTDTVRTPDIKTVAIPEVPSFVFNYALHDTMIRDTDDYTVSDDITGTYIQEYTITLTLRDPDNMQWADGTSRPQHLPWAIASDNVNQGNASDTFLYGLSTNHNRVAAEPMGVGADVILRSRVTHDNTEYFHYALVYFGSREILASRAFTGDLLLVGGGGGGGGGSYGQSAGGGGAGGVVLFENCGFEGGYFLNVGKGGNGSGDAASGKNGENTFISLTQGGDALSGWIVHGGGGGGGISINGSPGGCGGGAGGTASGTPYSAGSGIEGEGYSGGVNGTLSMGGGGGGAGCAASGVAAGDGKLVNVLGYDEYFGGGGRGGEGAEAQNSGGKGGGGASRPRFVEEGPIVDRIAGKNGQGGGGGGSNHNSNSGNSKPGGRGGDGLIVIAYEIEVGKLLDRPILSSDRLTYSGGVIAATNYLTFAKNMEFSGTVEATDVGTYTFTVAPAEDYHWSDTLDSEPITFTWTIVAKPIQGNVTVDAIANQAYSGSEIRPSFTVRDTARGTTLVAGADYTAEYFANINIGTATIKLTGIGNYTGNEWANFRIVADPNVTGYYVTPDADGSGDGTGWTSPFTLQQAFNAVKDLDYANTVAIYVKTGTYVNADGPWQLDKKCRLRVLGGYLGLNLARSQTAYTILDGGNARGLLRVSARANNWGNELTFGQIEFRRAQTAVHLNQMDYWSTTLRFDNCRFLGNSVTASAAASAVNMVASAIQTSGNARIVMTGCDVRGNVAKGSYGTTIWSDGQPYGLILKNSAFVGNTAQCRPSVIKYGATPNNPVEIDGCTFAYNAVATDQNNPSCANANDGIVIFQNNSLDATSATTVLANSIFYGNRQFGGVATRHDLYISQVELSGVKLVTIKNVMFEAASGYYWPQTPLGTDTITYGDPLFATALPTVSFGADYNPTWSVDPVNMDVHLKSVMGRWDGSAWVNDTVTSPAIDAGDPASDYAAEPSPNGGRVNLGAYGNTAEASKSYEVPATDAATLSGATGFSEIKQLDNGHTVLIYSNVTDAASFTVADGGIARILVVGGGGSGGVQNGYNGRAGGGGAGGFVESNAVTLAAGTYTVKVGKGGDAVSTTAQGPSLAGDNGGSSFVKLGGALVLAEAIGGGGGGAGGGSDGAAPKTGGSGGGRSYEGGDVGASGTPGQGFAGGGIGRTAHDAGGGGGGAGSVGSTPRDNVNPKILSTNGGDAKLSDITGELRAYAGGGAGCVSKANGDFDKYTHLGGSAGGMKVGGDVYKAGVNGTGSGGGGGDAYSGSGFVSGAGGSGIVVVHLYTKWAVATVTLDHNDGTGESDSVFVKADAPMPELPLIPSRHSYAFAGYFDAVTGGTQYYDAFGESAHVWDKPGDATLYAHWDPVKYHVINKTSGPMIVVAPEWLESAFGSEKTTEQYQDELFTTNASGVVAWQAYVLGFDADKRTSAAIVEETVQNANPDTVTIKLRDWEALTPRTNENCRLAYSLLSARTPEGLTSGGGTVVTNKCVSPNVPYEKRPEWSFEAPLSDLSDAEPVNYYRIKVHFIFDK